MVRELGAEPEALCRAAQGLVAHPGDAFGGGLPDDRQAERNTRRASALLQRALTLDPSPLGRPRRPEHRVVGTCRHFAVLAVAFLRAAGVPARARCGFASYFVPGRKVDHWVAEHWRPADRRWVRIDVEVLGGDVVDQPHDLRPGQFVTGGEAWQLIRAGAENAADFGVDGTDNWGPGEVRGNAIRDLAALNKVEMLPWDEWGQMADSYAGATGDDFDREIDDVAAACAGDDPAALPTIYARFPVPDDMVG